MPEAKNSDTNTLICSIPEERVAGPITLSTSRTPGSCQSHTSWSLFRPSRLRAGSWISHWSTAPTVVLAASTMPPSTAVLGERIALPTCHQSRAMPTITARLESSGLTEGNQNTSAALRAPKPRPIRPANRAIGAIQRSCSTAMS